MKTAREKYRYPSLDIARIKFLMFRIISVTSPAAFASVAYFRSTESCWSVSHSPEYLRFLAAAICIQSVPNLDVKISGACRGAINWEEKEICSLLLHFREKNKWTNFNSLTYLVSLFDATRKRNWMIESSLQCTKHHQNDV